MTGWVTLARSVQTEETTTLGQHASAAVTFSPWMFEVRRGFGIL